MRGAVRPAGRPSSGWAPCRWPEETRARALRSQISGLGPSDCRPTAGSAVAASLTRRLGGIGFCPSAPVRGSFPNTFQIPESASPPPHAVFGAQTPASEAGILELSPSKRRRTGPRGQLGLSPPLLPSRGGFPGPPLRKGEGEEEVARRGEGNGLLAPSPRWAQPLEDPTRRRKHWGAIVTPTR